METTIVYWGYIGMVEIKWKLLKKRMLCTRLGDRLRCLGQLRNSDYLLRNLSRLVGLAGSYHTFMCLLLSLRNRVCGIVLRAQSWETFV